MWFIAQVKLDRLYEKDRNRELFEEYETKILPALSVSNVREILKACPCRGDLTVEESAYVAMTKLFSRQCSTISRQENQKKQEKRKKLDEL